MAGSLERRLCVFRIVFVAVVAWPWLLRIALAVLGEFRLGFLGGIGLAIALGLIVAGVRNPSGIAPWLVVIWLCFDGVNAVTNVDIPDWWAIVVVGEALVVALLLMPMWRPLRRERARTELEHVGARAVLQDQRSSARRTERALRRTTRD